MSYALAKETFDSVGWCGAAFHIKTKCSAYELKKLYEAGPMDKFESVELELLTVENLLMEGSTILY